jgi:hypothetical protein
MMPRGGGGWADLCGFRFVVMKVEGEEGLDRSRMIRQ